MKKFRYHVLMLKTHKITSLKYLCKKSTDCIDDCHKYLGSGTYWKRHLSLHGKDITTEILEICDSKEDLIQKGIEWSKKLDVVNSDQFANLVEERGDGGPTFLGRKHKKSVLRKRSITMKKTIESMTVEQRESWRVNNKLGHAQYVYITPKGEYIDTDLGSKENGISKWELRCRCRLYSGKIISGRRFIKNGWVGKTWKELGWDYRLNA